MLDYINKQKEIIRTMETKEDIALDLYKEYISSCPIVQLKKEFKTELFLLSIKNNSMLIFSYLLNDINSQLILNKAKNMAQKFERWEFLAILEEKSTGHNPS